MPKQLFTSPKTQNRLDLVTETLPVPCLCIVGFSNSGKTREITELVELAENLHPNLPLIVISSNPEGILAKNADAFICYYELMNIR